jgi:hypothetical protein
MGIGFWVSVGCRAIRAWTTSRGRPTRRPRRTTVPNSWLRVSRAAAGSTASR